jgi:hypothetical protein
VYANESPSVSVLNKSPHQSAAILEGSRAGRFINWRNISEFRKNAPRGHCASLLFFLSKCNWGRYRPSAHHKRSPIDGHRQFQCLNGWNEKHFHWKHLQIRIARAKLENCSQCAQPVNHLQRHPAVNNPHPHRIRPSSDNPLLKIYFHFIWPQFIALSTRIDSRKKFNSRALKPSQKIQVNDFGFLEN